ncbi:MAG: hypothetical protein ACREAZ_09530 [Nitrososphaera sp.]
MEDLAHVPASAVRRPSHEDTITEAHFILDGAFDVLRAARRGNQPEFVSELGRLICQAERLIRMRKE